MNLLNARIIHKALGAGTVTAFDGKYLTVAFSTKTSKFVYPDAFQTFIKAEDPALQSAIIAEIEAAQKAEEDRKRAEEEARKQEEARRLAELAEKAKQKMPGQNPTTSKPTVKAHRVDGQSWTFFVFQGTTFDRESHNGYMWAPITNRDGQSFHHWDRLLDVRKGDIILHGCDGYIQAISIAVDRCYECAQPKELVPEDLWDMEGRRVDCDYTLITRPIKTANYVDEILKYCNVKYAPFDKNGSGNMGYLYEINRNLARFFIKETAKANPYIFSIPEVQKLIIEEPEE